MKGLTWHLGSGEIQSSMEKDQFANTPKASKP